MSSNVIPFGQQCQATRKDGSPCRARAIASSGYCVGHLPDAHEHRVKGGHNRSKAARSLKLLPERLRPVADMLAKALEEVHDGTLDPRQASAMAALAGALTKVVMSGEVEERLRALEAASGDDEVA